MSVQETDPNYTKEFDEVATLSPSRAESLAARLPITTPSSLMLGAPGGGKTWSLTSYMENDVSLFVVITEPNGLDTLLDAVDRKGLDIDKLHWHVISPVAAGWAAIDDLSHKVNNLTFEDLAKIKSGIGKRESTQFIQLVKCLKDFHCERTGNNYGDVTTWGPGRALAIDSLSGLNMMAMELVVGQKPNPAPGEWGVAMNMEETLINKLTSELRCFFTLTGHIDREVDEVHGGTKITAGALGRKLGPRLPRFFSEVFCAHRIGDKFFWSTTSKDMDLKARVLGLSDQLAPTFKPIVEAYRRRYDQATKQGA